MSKIHRSQILKEIKEEFPDIRAQINAQQGYFLMEMTVFGDYIFKLFYINQTSAKKALQMMDKYLENGNEQVQNTIWMTFIKQLSFGPDFEKDKRYKLMPVSLRNSYRNFLEYEKTMNDFWSK